MALKNEKILIFGGTGSLGQSLIRRLGYDNKLILFSRDEAKHWTIRNKISPNLQISFMVGDIRDRSRVDEALIQNNPTIVIIASALKQVDTCEISPFESIQTNLLGIRNVTDSVMHQINRLSKLQTVLMVSTDKACAPTNVYGMCKAIAERVVTSSGRFHTTPKFVGVRYGNVLESRGSIIPLFKHQVESQDFLTVTNKSMTRFIMTLDQSIDLIEKTIMKASTGEIWIPRLKSMKILDLAGIFAQRYGKSLKITGIRPGEKIHEDLISEPESVRTKASKDYYILNSPFSTEALSESTFTYSSKDDLMNQQELTLYLDSIGIFSKGIKDFLGREIEEIQILGEGFHS